jgi:beta-glucosidase
MAQLPYQDIKLTAEKRAEDLITRLTLEEKVSLMMDASKPVERLGIKGYNWWNEALHGVARAGVATVFPQPIGMAATFHPKLIEQTFSAVSDEARAKNTMSMASGDIKRYQGLTMWTPTVNIFRDPRWGRGIETYGEDPFLTSIMGVSVVNGLQGPNNVKYDKVHACAKHFAVHSGPEWNRHSFNVNDINKRELYETYLPPFKALVQDANVKEVMCAYNRFEDEPCCGSKRLLNNILRNDWGFDGIVVADCGAIADFYKPNAHATHENAATASADAVYSGTDLDCGSSYKSLVEAVQKGIIAEKDIDVSVKRLLKARFELGEMDDPSVVSWTKIPYSVVASAKHDSIALKVARESMVLLLNKNNILPLKNRNLKIAVMGPNANDSIMQWGNYNGTPTRTITILEGIKSAVGSGNTVMYEKGCDLVEKTLFTSAFNNSTSVTGKGFSAKYWNNSEMMGETVAQTQVENPFRFCTSGATVFAPGVNLTDFSATYNSTFIPQQSGEIIFDFYYCGSVRLFVNGTEFKPFRSNHGPRRNAQKMKVEAGQKYDIQIDFAYTMGDAQLNFDLGFKQEIDIEKTIDNVKNADVIIFAGGISPQLEGEEMGVNLPGFKGGDRTDIELPEVQRNFLKALHAAGKKVIFVNCSGSPIGLEPETENCEAILQAWYPGQAGGKAVADVLFGKYNPAGRLPVTFYKNVHQLPDFENYNMKGRTYRFMTETPLFPFGHGLSYTSFKYGKVKLDKKQINTGKSIKLSVKVKNSGKIAGEEVVQVYMKKLNDTDGPEKTLRAFRRVNIPAGKTAKLVFELNDKNLEWWDADTNTLRMHTGEYQLYVGGSSRSEDVKTLNLSIK